MVFRPLFAALLLLSPLAPAAGQSAGHSLRQDYSPAPAIWKLADEDTTIYLFGTIHVLPAGFRWRSAQFDQILSEIDTLVLESSDEDAQTSLAVFGGKIGAVQAGRAPTSERIAPELRDRWRQMVEASGRYFEAVDEMPLPLALLGFDGGGAQNSAARRDLGVESILTDEFTAAGRPIESIENSGAVMLSIMRIDEGPILRELEAELARLPVKPVPSDEDQAPGADWSMEHAWARGELDPNFSLGTGKVGETFDRVLLARRNEAWSHWLKRRLEQPGTIMVAVGAGHFEGRRSVHYFLEERGLRAERIN